jgi:hypothetical protein
MKFKDIVFLQYALFMYQFHHKIIPTVFEEFFTPTSEVHKYSTRLACQESFYMHNIRSNYGKFIIRFSGAKIWNCLPYHYKVLSLSSFKHTIICDFLSNY